MLTACPRTEASADTPVTLPVGADAVAGEACATDELARLDGRQPFALTPMMAWHQKQNMMDHLVVVQEMTGALARSDFDGVANAVKRLESSTEQQASCEMFSGADSAFLKYATQLYRGADNIGPAARQKDTAEVLKLLNSTLTASTQCHATSIGKRLSRRAPATTLDRCPITDRIDGAMHIRNTL